MEYYIKKLKLLFYNSILQSQSIANNHYFDPMNKLISNISEIDELKHEKHSYFQYLYLNKIKIHPILYDKEEVIQVNPDIIGKQISNYFYLYLLIDENPDIINYTFPIDVIRNLIILLKNFIKNNINKLLISKIVNNLIKYYIESNDYKNDYKNSEENELEIIEKESLEFIKNSLGVVNDLNLNYTIDDIIKIKIDLIYIKIIISLLIKEHKSANYEYIVNILKELDIENINITETMFNEVDKFLNNEKYINNYYIKNIKDLDNIEIINFYYLLFKYILKNPIYIYQIKILYQIRKNIIIYIKTHNEKYEEQFKDKEEKKYVIKFFLDSEYYFSKYNNYNKPNNNMINNMKDNKYDISTAVKNKTQDDNCKNSNKDENKVNMKEMNKEVYELFMKKILYKSSFLLKRNKHGKVVFSILNDEKKIENCNKQNLNRKLKDERKILEYNFKKFVEFLSVVKDKIESEFIYEYNLIIKLDCFIDEYHTKTDSYLYNMICKYYFYPPNKDRLSSFQDENVLINGIDGIHQGFYFLISEINDENYKDILYNEKLDILNFMKEKEKYETQLKTIKKEAIIEEKKPFSLMDIIKSDVVPEYQVIKINNIIGYHSDNAEFIQSLTNDFYISGGNERTLFIYNQKYKKILDINLSIHPIGLCQINHQENDNNISIVAFSNENINIITFEPNDNTFIVQYYKNFATNILEISNKKYIIASIKGVYIVNNLATSLDNFESERILKHSYRATIKISEYLVALTSNNILHNGKNRIVIYDLSSNDIFYELDGYSFSLSLHSLLLLDNYESRNPEKILLCGCRKYTSYNQNGILLLSIQIKDNEDIYNTFFETGRFEPYCFCQILLINNSKENIENSKKEYSTDYFFIGGYDSENGKGIIKLYKIIFNYISYKTNIEYIQDIIFTNEYKFKGAVTNIIQSRTDGHFLISCSDGFVYHCSPANINYFLYNDEEKKKTKLKLNYVETTSFYNSTTILAKDEKENDILKYDNKQIFKCLLDSFKKQIPCDVGFFL